MATRVRQTHTSRKRSSADPHAALHRPVQQLRPATHAAPRTLTEKQLKNPLIRAAFRRLGSIIEHRGQYLRGLDTVHGDRRTRLEKWAALQQIAEPLLVRLDIAESVLGYLDEDGRYVLNTQCNLAADAGISAPVLNRLMATLDAADYVYRRIERVRLEETDSNGLHLVRTRVLIRFTMKFWADLGLRYVWERARKSAIKKRQAALRLIQQKRSAEIEQRSLATMRRERRRADWQRKTGEYDGQKGTEKQAQALRSVDPIDRLNLMQAIARERGIPVHEARAIADEMLQAELARRHRA